MIQYHVMQVTSNKGYRPASPDQAQATSLVTDHFVSLGAERQKEHMGCTGSLIGVWTEKCPPCSAVVCGNCVEPPCAVYKVIQASSPREASEERRHEAHGSDSHGAHWW